MTVGTLERELLSSLDPRELQGLEAWYDANHINGFGAAQPAEGAALAQWNDLSGKNRHLLQATASLKPLYRGVPNSMIPSSVALVGGATVDANGVYTTGVGPGINGIQVWVAIPGGNGARIWFAADWFPTVQSPYAPFQPNGGAYWGTNYYAADKVTPVNNTAGNNGNGRAVVSPINAWARDTNVFAIGPGIYWAKFTLGNSGYTAPGTLFKNIDLYVEYAGALAARAFVAPMPGGPTVEFDGVDDYMATAAAINLNGGTAHPVTFYTVGTWSGPNAVGALGLNQRFISSSTDGTNGTLRCALFPNTNQLLMYSSQNGVIRAAMSPNVPLVGSGWVDGVNRAAVTFSGLPLLSPATAVGSSGFKDKFFVSAVAANQALYGNISAGLFFSVKHDEATRRRIEQWLGGLYGIPLART